MSSRTNAVIFGMPVRIKAGANSAKADIGADDNRCGKRHRVPVIWAIYASSKKSEAINHEFFGKRSQMVVTPFFEVTVASPP